MAEKITVTINGNKVDAQSGQTILDVIREHKLDDIPTLCHDPKLPPYGSCYLCVVEVEGAAKLIPSCASPVNAGMVIHTNNERIREARKTALELLLSNHYADCVAPCKQTCPAGVDVQGYIALMAAGKNREAVCLIKETNPLPLVCGRVCVRECEVACRRNRVDEGVGIDYLKRYATDIDIEDPWAPVIPPPIGKKVAIVGGGPAGLTCAYYLILKGFAVTLFERAPKLGGMLRYGIPEYRLPKNLLDKEINWIVGLGVDVRTNSCMGKDFNLESLKTAGYDAIFLSFGAQKAKGMRLPEEEATPGVLRGIDFLWQLQGETKPGVHGTVVVVGGGNTAIDAARTAKRLGAQRVIILYRRTRNEMPAHPMEIEAAMAEKVEMIFLSAPTQILKQEGRLTGLNCIRMELGEPDESGRRSPIPVSGSDYTLNCDFIISAIGQDVDLCGLNRNTDFKATRQGTVVFDKDSFETSIPGVFAGGDMATGPSVAIAAIAHGKIAAAAIEHYVRTGSAAGPRKEFLSKKDAFGEIPDSEFSETPKIAREKMPELPAEERIRDFREVELGFTPLQARTESSRCLECGCSAYFECDLRKHATDFGIDITPFIGEVRKYKTDSSHPFIVLDPNKCIACGRCVRTCSEVLKVSALGFVYRGFKSIVKPSMEKGLLQTNCISCGNCIAACPTGAITEHLPFSKPGPWRGEKIRSVCHFCSLGCQICYRVYERDLFTVESPEGNSHNKGYLCLKGRFGYRYMIDTERLLKPMLQKKGTLREVDWKEAIDSTATKLKSILRKYGPEAVAIFGSPRMTNEELYLLQRWLRTGFRSNQIGSFSTLMQGADVFGLDPMIGVTTSTATLADLKQADLIMVLNSDLTADHLIAELKIKDAVKKGGRLIAISSSETPLSKFADLWIDTKRGTGSALLDGLSNFLIQKGAIDRQFIGNRTTGYEAFRRSVEMLDVERLSSITGVDKKKLEHLFHLVARPGLNLMILYGIDSFWEKSARDLQSIGNLLLLQGRFGRPGNGLILLRDYSNSQGLFDMGMDPHHLPGHVGFHDRSGKKRLEKLWKTELDPVFKPTDLKMEMEKGNIKAMLIFGEDPLAWPANQKYFSGVEFLLVSDFFQTATAAQADVLLPMSLPIEGSGSMTSCERRLQKTTQIFSSKTGMENWQMIKALAEGINMPLPFESVDAVFSEIQAANPFYLNVAPGDIWGNGMLNDQFLTSSGKGKFSQCEIDFSPYSIEKQTLLPSESYFQTKIQGKLVI